jgi:hypothetical protein
VLPDVAFDVNVTVPLLDETLRPFVPATFTVSVWPFKLLTTCPNAMLPALTAPPARLGLG